MFEASFPLPPTIEMRNPTMSITDNSIIVVTRDLLCCNLSEGAVILDLKSGIYYGLDAVGTFIWSQIQEPKSLRDIGAAVLEEYAVEPERCAQDLKVLVSEMAERNLIEVKDE